MNPYKALMNPSSDLETLFSARGSLRSQLLLAQDFPRRTTTPSTRTTTCPSQTSLSPCATPLVAYYPSASSSSTARHLTSMMFTSSSSSSRGEGESSFYGYLSRRPSEQTSMSSIPESLDDTDDSSSCDADDQSW